MCDCNKVNLAATAKEGLGQDDPVTQPMVPLAAPLLVETMDYEASATTSEDLPEMALSSPSSGGPGFPPWRRCHLNFPDGCYMLTLQSNAGAQRVGTLRVDHDAPSSGQDAVIVSGDLYYPDPPVVFGSVKAESATSSMRVEAHASSAAAAAAAPIGDFLAFRPKIPIYSRSRYHSYLRATQLTIPLFSFWGRPCQVTIGLEQFDYSPPPTGFFQGSFPSAASRRLTFTLNQESTGPINFLDGPAFSGRYQIAGVDAGSVSLKWVSSFLRRAVLEIDTLTGAVGPSPVPSDTGAGTQFFDTIFAGAKWDLDIVQDQTNIPVPPNVQANQCWSDADLHDLMSMVRRPGTNLDEEWWTHLVVVPAKLGCYRGTMYDLIDVPREGAASFSDDGYPQSESANFGAAQDQLQRNVPRAFLRSAAHEVTHAFNQIHQSLETMADNSIMTTTPDVADVLGGQTTGAAGVFPDQINLAFNATVRNHLAHMPDPVVRPGGWPFSMWQGSLVQAADRAWFNEDELSLDVSAGSPTSELGAPVMLTWTLTNNGGQRLAVPSDIGLDALYGNLEVTDDRGVTRHVRPFVIKCETAKLKFLKPGDSISADHRVFWSSGGFALGRPGRHRLSVIIAWSANGLPVGVRGSTEVWVNYPTTDAANADAALVMDPEVGKWVALGGGAYHLKGAVERLQALTTAAEERSGDSEVLRAFVGLLPTDTEETPSES
jgi:hypothetical protein